MQTYKIVVITGMGNARAVKVAIPLVAEGHETKLITNKPSPYLEIFHTVSLYKTMEQFRNIISEMGDADIFHVHNEPAWFVSVIKEVWGDKKPIIIDVHDSTLIRGTGISLDERNNFQLADGIVYVSQSSKELIAVQYGLCQPNIVLPTYVPERFYAVDLSRTPYQGGLLIAGGVNAAQNDPFEYMNYLQLAQKCESNEIPLHIITPERNPQILKQYEPYARLHQPLEIAQYINYSAGFGWGFVGNIKPYPFWQYALPNRFFEYVAAGIPIMAMNAPECECWVNQGLGVVVENVAEIKEKWSQCDYIRKKALKERHKYTMEANIGELIKLYEEVV